MNTIVRVCVCLITTCGLPAPVSFAQVSIEKPVLVKNINTATVSEPLTPVTELNGMLIFKAFTPGSGWELWKSDGSEWGAVRIKDINAGPASALEPEGGSLSFVSLGGLLLFAADDGIHGVELWKTDGTEDGTVQVKDILAGPLGSRPKGFLSLNGVLYFTAEGEFGAELWKSDGTTAGTLRVKLLPNDYASPLARCDETIFFVIGNALWKSDGTETGTILVHSITGDDRYRLGPICANGTVFFFTSSSLNGSAVSLWKSDGTARGTVRIKDLYLINNNGLGEVFTANGMLFFNAHPGLWMSDGTGSGTSVFGGYGGGPRSVVEKVEIGGALFLSLGTPAGGELWRSDGTVAGTLRLRAYPRNPNNGAAPSNLFNANGTLLFTAYDEASGFELWRSDGTPAGTVRVKDIVPGAGSSFPRGYVNLNGNILFTTWGTNAGLNLWKTDGTEPGTALIKRILAGANGFYPYAYGQTVISNRAVFMAGASANKVELWTTDGTGSGTNPIHEFDRVPDGDIPNVLSSTSGMVFITGPQAGKGLGLWRTDGTSTGTFPVRDASSRDYGSLPGTPVDCNGTVFFSANVSELWKSDGTENGTILVKVMNQDQEGRQLSNFVNVNGTLFFTRSFFGGDGLVELWKSDGTEKGTVRVKASRSNVREAINLKGQLFFAADADELWKSDGTESGTELVKQFALASHSFLGSFVTVGNNLFFSALNSINGWELWKTDGTATGTILVKDIVPGPDGFHLRSFVNVNKTLFFILTGLQGSGDELWQSDGTAAGTVRVKKFPEDSLPPDSLVALNGMLFFTADEPRTGNELWRSDGTESGTIPFKDINPGTASSYPNWLTRVGETLFFWVHVGDDHWDLWKTDGSDTGTMLVTENVPAPTLSEVAGRPASANGVLYFFVGTDPVGRNGIWRSDGTAAGTYRLPDPADGPLAPYSNFIYPSVMVEANGTIFFRADDGVTGFELWKIGDQDKDSDGLPDWWESRFFFSKNANPEDDPDGDGMNNWEESRAGTDPTSPSSVLKLTQIRPTAGGKVQVEWSSALNQEYVLLRSATASTDLRDYTTVERRIRATPPVNSYIDATARGSGPYFYRLKIEE